MPIKPGTINPLDVLFTPRPTATLPAITTALPVMQPDLSSSTHVNTSSIPSATSNPAGFQSGYPTHAQATRQETVRDPNQGTTRPPRRKIVTRPPNAALKSPPVASETEISAPPPKKRKTTKRKKDIANTLPEVATLLSKSTGRTVRMEDIRSAAKIFLRQLTNFEFHHERHTIKFRSFGEVEGIVSGILEIFLGNPKSSRIDPIRRPIVYISGYEIYRRRYPNGEPKIYLRPIIVGRRPDTPPEIPT